MSRTLFGALQELPDQRGRKGRQIPLPEILALAVAAMLAGADSLIAIFRWGRRLRPEALCLLGFADGVAPCHATYHYVFRSLDADALARVLGRFALGDAGASHIAMMALARARWLCSSFMLARIDRRLAGNARA